MIITTQWPELVLLIVAILLIFFSAATHSKNLELWGILIIISIYFLLSVIYALFYSLKLWVLVDIMRIRREYSADLKEEEEEEEEINGEE